MLYYRGMYAHDVEAKYKQYYVCVYFDKNWTRMGCDCSIEQGADLKFVVIPEEIRQASLLWSNTAFRDTMLLGDFLKSTLG